MHSVHVRRRNRWHTSQLSPSFYPVTSSVGSNAGSGIDCLNPTSKSLSSVQPLSGVFKTVTVEAKGATQWRQFSSKGLKRTGAPSVLTSIYGVAEIGNSPANGISFVLSARSSTKEPYHCTTRDNLVREGMKDMVASPNAANTNELTMIPATNRTMLKSRYTWHNVRDLARNPLLASTLWIV
ncbi:hypothetical protein SVAN01_04783 [Stagonosporopsis vannaccii]|nr:hypothetical protein SVAN01_04783 [Stagonosporopsis vannaccii]